MSHRLQIIKYPPRYPKSVHLYITNICNLNCKKCHYRSPSDPKQELSFEIIKDLFIEWKRYGLTSIAIGGGEPLLHPNIVEIIDLGHKMGYFMAVTTNGTVLKPLNANRIHISYDTLHPTWKDIKLIQKAIDHYKKSGCKVGINHVITNIENLHYIENNLRDFDNILLIREKPISYFKDWEKIAYQKNYWIEGCMENSRCEQGILSFHVDFAMNASICSNLAEKIPYTTLRNTWVKLKCLRCEIRDQQQDRLDRL